MGKQPMVPGRRNIVVTGNHNTVITTNDPSGDSWAQYNSPRVKWVRRSVLTLIALVLALIALPLIPLVAWQWIVTIVSVAAACGTVWLCGSAAMELVTDRRKRQQAIAARCDAQHQAILDGDERTGIYGNYPPVV